jgi:hypothetical protein
MSDIFLSYSTDDHERAREVALALEARGWSVWWDRKIPPGKTFDEVIEEHLDSARCVVTLWTPKSVKSRWVKAESEEGARRGCLVPVLLAPGVTIPLAFRRIQAADLMDWQAQTDHAGFESLVGAIAALLGPAPRSGTVTKTVAAGNRPDSPQETSDDERPVGRKDHSGGDAVDRATGDRSRRGLYAVIALLVVIGGLVGLWTVWNPGGANGSGASLAVDTQPEQALVSVNGIERGRSPLTIADLEAGEVRVEARLPGHAPAVRKLSLSSDERATVTLLLAPLATSGTLVVSSRPSGATWTLDGKPQDQQTPAKVTGIDTGLHRVRVEKAGYAVADHPITIRAGRSAKVHTKLRPAARLTVRAKPADARVQVMDVAPPYSPGMTLKPGRHRIRVTRQGYLPFDQSRDLEAGEQVIEVQLRPRPESRPEAEPGSEPVTTASP